MAIAAGKCGHNVDVFHSFKRANRTYTIKPVRHHNRQLYKSSILKGGIRKSNQAAMYVKGFRLFDKVLFDGVECYITGRRTSGYFALKTISGEKIHNSASYKKIHLLERSTNYLIT